MLSLPVELTGSIKLSALRKIESVRSADLVRHESTVAVACGILCRAIGLDDQLVLPTTLGAELHDIGKLGISDELLNKPGPLTADERAVVRGHSLIGFEILTGAGDRLLEFSTNIVRVHHEYFDGSGYPDGLKGEEIPIGGRIVALCDVYDALRSDRPYRAGMSHREALAVITGEHGRSSRGKFDPALLRAFVSNSDAICEIYTEASR